MEKLNQNSLHNESINELLALSSVSSPNQEQVPSGVKDRKGNIRLEREWNLKDNLSSDEQELLSKRRVG